jgi:RNA 3'-terminal phosphate cyclase (ATP)
MLCEFEHSQCCYTALGALGKPAEQVADEVCDKVEQFVDAGSSIDEYTADQLILPLSLAKSDSKFTTSIITDHLLTNVQVIKEFIQPNIEIRGNVSSPGEILIQPNP